MTEIDEIDRRLLRALQADGRITNQALARKIHLSPAACSERVKRLRERGVIAGYTAVLDPVEIVPSAHRAASFIVLSVDGVIPIHPDVSRHILAYTRQFVATGT